MSINVGTDVHCIITMRRNKDFFHRYGEPARNGDQGTVIRITELKDVCIVEFMSARGKVHAHIQNLVDE